MPLNRLRLGYLPLLDAAPLILAGEMGVAREEGLDLRAGQIHRQPNPPYAGTEQLPGPAIRSAAPEKPLVLRSDFTRLHPDETGG